MGEKRSWYSWVGKLPGNTPQEALEELLHDYQDHAPYYDDADEDEE